VQSLILLDKDTVVYVTGDNDIWWCATDKNKWSSPEMRYVEERLAELSLIPVRHLNGRHRLQIASIAAEGVAAVLSCRNDPKDKKAALASAGRHIGRAIKYAKQRNFEVERRWFLATSLGAVLLACLCAAVVSGYGSPAIWSATQFLVAGSIGAFLSIAMHFVARTANAERDAMAGGDSWDLVICAAAKVAAGAFGAILVGVAVKAGIMMSIADDATHRALPEPLTLTPLELLLAILAGLSERFVPAVASHLDDKYSAPEQME
jgi:hypothetical protein